MENFSDLSTAAASSDSTADGQSDLAEALASSSPSSPDDRLKILNLTVSANGSEITL